MEVLRMTIGQKKHNSIAQYTVKEEVANSVIHGAGVAFSLVSLTVLLVLASLFGAADHLVSYLIYGIIV